MQTIVASQRDKIKELVRVVSFSQGGSKRIMKRKKGKEFYEEKIFDMFSDFIRSKVYYK